MYNSFPGTREIRIETNYRSTPEILTLANYAIAANTRQFPKNLHAVRPAEKFSKPALICLQDANQQANFICQRIEELQDPTVRDPAIAAFQDKVAAVGDTGLAADAAEVTITLKDGRSHTSRIDHCIGSASNPMSDAQLTRKFSELAEPVIGAALTKELVDRTWAVEQAADVGDPARACG